MKIFYLLIQTWSNLKFDPIRLIGFGLSPFDLDYDHNGAESALGLVVFESSHLIQ